MKSFSGSVKEHILDRSFEELGFNEKERVKWKECCCRAFLRGVFLFLVRKEDGQYTVTSSRFDLLEIVTFLLIRLFDTEVFVTEKRKKGRQGDTLLIPEELYRTVLRETSAKENALCDRCRVLLIRAAFLSCGTILNPQKGYHAAFRLIGKNGAAELQQALERFDLIPTVVERENEILMYIKESAKIEDLLSVIGAQHFSLELMNRRVERSIRANINRRQNFDAANLKKTVNGAQNAIEAIRYLEKNDLLKHLPESLQKAAKLRMSYPEVSLGELCLRSEDEITKSGLNHRLQKLVLIAEKTRKEGTQT